MDAGLNIATGVLQILRSEVGIAKNISSSMGRGILIHLPTTTILQSIV